MNIPLIYEIPLFLFIGLAIYTIYAFFAARKIWAGGTLVKTYSWLILATIFFTLWGIDHVYHDMFPLSEKLLLFFHYGISHGFLLISMICLAISAYQTKLIAKIRNNVK
jgi:hypothetical protein